MKSLYDMFMIPLEKRGIRNARKRLIPKAKGRVLEIGAGTGANLPFYQFDQIETLVLTDKSLSKHIDKHPLNDKIELLETIACELPFEDNSFDTIVHTLVFCSVENVNIGLQELKRVLKEDGELIFIEHVLPHKKGMRRLFKTINPVWRRVSGGCNLTRSYQESLIQNGFQVNTVDQFMNTVFICGTASKLTRI